MEEVPWDIKIIVIGLCVAAILLFSNDTILKMLGLSRKQSKKK
jgi:hypothetical protein